MKKVKQIVVGLGIPVSADHKQVLLTKRHAPSYPAWHNKWQIAGGGHEIGESIEDTVVRELWEELRVQATILSPYPIVRTNYWTKAAGDEGEDFEAILLAYLVDIGGATPDLSQDLDHETSEWGWFTLEEVKKLDFLPKTQEIVESAFTLLSNMR